MILRFALYSLTSLCTEANEARLHIRCIQLALQYSTKLMASEHYHLHHQRATLLEPPAGTIEPKSPPRLVTTQLVDAQ